MRSLVLTLTIAALSFSAKAQQSTTPPAADQIVKEACTAATKNHKKVFVLFHASWCGWCHKMDTAMNDASIKKLFTDNYEIRHITVSETGPKTVLNNPGGTELLAKYHGDQQGIPFWFILNADGSFVADSRLADASGKLQNVGCPAKKEEIDYFLGLLKKSSKMKRGELEAVRTRFAKIEPQAAH